MFRTVLVIAVTACLVSAIYADTYLHGCIAGSNNKLNEQSNTRDTQRRLFNSQNGNNGGCNTITDAPVPVPFYYVGSVMPLYYVTQHGGGSNSVTRGDQIFQVMCDNYTPETFGWMWDQSGVRDGTSTTKIAVNAAAANDTQFGKNEPLPFYEECRARLRNEGLFTADQNLNGATADFTRQNPNGDTNDDNRGGYECPEERDYYPYWHPSPWMDVSLLLANTSQCAAMTAESQNVVTKGYCTVAKGNNDQTCAAEGGAFQQVGLFNLPAPDCLQQEYTETNHLGFSSSSRDGTTYLAHVNLTIPDVAAGSCVLRMRYNMTQPEVADPTLDASDNAILEGDPDFIFDSATYPNHPIQLAINTNQYSRTFEDRSHVFSIVRRPESLESATIFNLGTIGKRGALQNIYPGMENDFCPKHMTVGVGDYVHWQWVGPNTGTANGRNNGGGGDANGDTRGNRHNVLQATDLGSNFPLALEESTMFEEPATATFFAYGGQDPANCVTGENGETQAGNCGKINTPLNGYFEHEPIRFNKTGSFPYFSTRNSINTNRDQKASLTIGFQLTVTSIIFIIIGAVALVVGAAAGLVLWQAKRNPTGRAATILAKLKSKASMRY